MKVLELILGRDFKAWAQMAMFITVPYITTSAENMDDNKALLITICTYQEVWAELGHRLCYSVIDTMYCSRRDL